MITATVTISDVAGSLYDLINTATPGQLNNFITGRVAEIQIQWESGTFHLVYKSGTTNVGAPTITLATDSGRLFVDPTLTAGAGNSAMADMTIRGAAGNNVLSLKDIYLVTPSAGAGKAKITAYTI